VTPEPYNWDVVIIGHWNRAILTPNGIAKRLFKLPEGTGIEVSIPVNLFGPVQVKHDGVMVRVEAQRIVIATEKASYKALNRAMATACNALRDLPETPVFAAGFNIRFKVDAQGEPSELDEIVQTSLDTDLSDAGYEIISRGLTRRVRIEGGIFEKGVLNLLVLKEENKPIRIEMNFHRDSNSVPELIKWLEVSEEDLKKGVSEILKKVPSLQLEEIERA
jgi:hypothetical protein